MVTFIGTHQLKGETGTLKVPDETRKVIIYTRDRGGEVHYQMKDYKDDLFRADSPINQFIETPAFQDPIRLFERNLNMGEDPILLKNEPLMMKADRKDLFGKKKSILITANSKALLRAMNPGDGIVIITDVSQQKLGGVQFCLQAAAFSEDLSAWLVILRHSFPSTYDALKNLVTPKLYNQLLQRIKEGRVYFHHTDLSRPEAYRPIMNYLKFDSIVFSKFIDKFPR